MKTHTEVEPRVVVTAPKVRAPLTDEDMWIRRRIAWRIAPSVLGAADYRYKLVAADRRDGDLMLEAMQHPFGVINRLREDDSGLSWWEDIFIRGGLRP